MQGSYTFDKGTKGCSKNIISLSHSPNLVVNFECDQKYITIGLGIEKHLNFRFEMISIRHFNSDIGSL